jgi:hypothetical protein
MGVQLMMAAGCRLAVGGAAMVVSTAAVPVRSVDCHSGIEHGGDDFDQVTARDTFVPFESSMQCSHLSKIL